MWCGKVIGYKEPFEDNSQTHGICVKCFGEEKKRRLRRKIENE